MRFVDSFSCNFGSISIGLLHIGLYACLCVHGTAETLDGVAELPDTQTALQTDVKETYCYSLISRADVQ